MPDYRRPATDLLRLCTCGHADLCHIAGRCWNCDHFDRPACLEFVPAEKEKESHS